METTPPHPMNQLKIKRSRILFYPPWTLGSSLIRCNQHEFWCSERNKTAI